MPRANAAIPAEDIAIQGLAFLAGDPERLARFLALTGLGPQNLRQAANEPGFLAAVLDYLASDESLLQVFAAHANLAPEIVAQARVTLGDGGGLREI